jgi:hypothetical protein
MRVFVTFEVDTDEAGALPTRAPDSPDPSGASEPSVHAVEAVTQWWKLWLRDEARAQMTPRLIAVRAFPSENT